MKMKIGLRTIKTAVGATLAIILAQALNLMYPASAGIITLLSVTNTKRSSFKVGFLRIIAWVLAVALSFCCFSLLGFNALGFGLFLLFFIPTAAASGLSEGIPVNAVLVTHFLIEQNMNGPLLLNSFLLLLIGVGIALLANLYMPNVEERIQREQRKIDEQMRTILRNLGRQLAKETPILATNEPALHNLQQTLDNAQTWATQYYENFLLSDNLYYRQYFDMRQLQVQSLVTMNELVQQVTLPELPTQGLVTLLLETAEHFSEKNDGQKIQLQIEAVLQTYRAAPLPRTRDEFEERAILYQVLTEFQRFIALKIRFSQTTPIR